MWKFLLLARSEMERNHWRSRAFFLALAAAAVAGAILRLNGVTEQIIADDEWHALRVALGAGPLYILTHFGVSDHCIPLAGLYAFLLHTTGLSELILRAPVLLCGLALPAVLPLLSRRYVGDAAAAAFAWLLAVSPPLVLFSGYARPYGITVLLSFVAVVAVFRWSSGGGRRYALIYVACTVLSAWLHLSTLPVVLAPLAFFAVERALFRRGSRRFLELVALACWTLLSIVAVLIVPLVVDFASLSGKAGGGAGVSLATVRAACVLGSGTGSAWLLGALAVGLACGAAALYLRARRFLLYLSYLVFVQALSIVLLRPLLIENPAVLLRYGLVLVPFALLPVSVSLGALERGVNRGRRLPPGWTGFVLAGALLVAGPMAFIFRTPNDWIHHPYFQSSASDAVREQMVDRILAAGVPPFYRTLAALPEGSLRIVEAPWYYGRERNAYPIYQREHRQWMAIGFVGKADGKPDVDELPRNDPRLRFRNFVDLADVDGLRERGVDLVVLHRHLRRELEDGALLREVDMSNWIDDYRRRYGEPWYEDAQVVAFDVTEGSRLPPPPATR